MGAPPPENQNGDRPEVTSPLKIERPSPLSSKAFLLAAGMLLLPMACRAEQPARPARLRHYPYVFLLTIDAVGAAYLPLYGSAEDTKGAHHRAGPGMPGGPPGTRSEPKHPSLLHHRSPVRDLRGHRADPFLRRLLHGSLRLHHIGRLVDSRPIPAAGREPGAGDQSHAAPPVLNQLLLQGRRFGR